jgi:acyl-CoA synthetase (AMP-forming)/AMP-acid ligase II
MSDDVASYFLLHAQRFYSSICFEYVVVDSVNLAEENPHQPPPLLLTYGDAIECYYQHVRYLYTDCLKMIPSTVDPQLSKTPWVIAYLSHNSIDYILSTLAAGSQNERMQCDGPRLLPVLLSTRWTVSEIVKVLQLLRVTEDTPGAVTILLFDASLQTVADQVQRGLVIQTKSHIVHCLPLPRVAHDWMFQRRQKANCRLPAAYASLVPGSVITETLDDEAARCSVEDAVVLFTSGTTSGQPLGVRLSHRAIYVQACAKQFLFHPSTRMFCHTVPFYHVGGLTNYFAVWLSGGTLVQPLHCQGNLSSMAPLSFDPHIIFQCWNRPNDCAITPNALVVVPAMLSMMQQYYKDHKEWSIRVFPHVRCILIGGQSAPRDVLRFLRHVFPNSQLVQTYACTEAASSMTFQNVTLDTGSADDSSLAETPFTLSVDVDTENAPDEFSRCYSRKDPSQLLPFGQCAGRPPAHVELYLWTEHWEEDKRTTAPADRSTPSWVIHTPYTPGIIVTRGPHVMNGYWSDRGRPRPMRSNDALLRRTGYYVTNDMGFWDAQGTLYYLGRRTDTIRTGGETVWCSEVERVVQAHPQVLECAVFGMSDARFGEVVCCAVVRGYDPVAPSLELEALRDWCGSNGLAGYKCPRHLLMRSSALPRNTNGKVLKFQLQAQLRRCLSNKATTTDTGIRLQSKL